MEKYLTSVLCFMCFLISNISAQDPPKFGDNEIYLKNDPFAAHCEATCANPSLMCIESKGVIWEGCHCQITFYRNQTGQCVRFEECKTGELNCGGQEMHFTGKYNKHCDATCRVKAGKCDAVPRIGCYCMNGYYRNSKSICVLEKDCGNEVKCGENETYKEDKAIPICQKTCSNRDIKCAKSSKKQVWKGCRCKDDFFRTTKGKCVAAKECDKKSGECAPNEDLLPATHVSETNGEATCRVKDVKKIKGTTEKTSGCYCKKGYLKNAKGVCILEAECKYDNLINIRYNF